MTSASLWPRGSTTADFFRPRRIAAALQQFRQQIIAAPVRQNVNTADRRRTAAGRFRQRKRPVENFATGHVGKMRASIYSPEKPNLSAQSAVVFSATGYKRRQTLPYARAGLPLSPAADFQNPRAPADFPAAAEQKIKRWQRHCRGYVTEIIDKAVRA